MNARPYQLECLNAAETKWQEFQRLLFVLPTGAGKTIIFCWMAAAEIQRGGRVLVLVDQKKLMYQTVEKMLKAAGLRCEPEGDGLRASRHAPVVAGMVQTMVSQLNRWPANHFALVIADEADKSISAEWQLVLKHFAGARVAGFTATPDRTDKRSLGVFYQDIAYQIGLLELIKQGYLSRIVVKQLPIKISLERVSVSQGDYNSVELHDAIAPHFNECALAIKEHASFRKTLVFVPLIATSQKFVQILNQHGIAAEHIDGTDDDQDEILGRFERGEFDVLVNSMLLTRGVDIPAIDCIMCLRATKSKTLIQQIFGRGTRLHEFKENLLILDPMFDADKRLICGPAHLIAETEDEARSITEAGSAAASAPGDGAGQLTAFDLLGMASVTQAQRERALRMRLEEHKDRQARTISAEEFALNAGHFDVAEYEPTMAWESNAVSEAQARVLAKAGIDVSTVKNRGQASRLIDIHIGQQPVKMADPKTVSIMQRLPHICAAAGVNDPAHATQREAGRFYAELNKRKKRK